MTTKPTAWSHISGSEARFGRQTQNMVRSISTNSPVPMKPWETSSVHSWPWVPIATSLLSGIPAEDCGAP